MKPVLDNSYSFKEKEQAYVKYRPSWPKIFALESLQKLGIQHNSSEKYWSGIDQRERPVIVCIGAGTGADAKTFLELGCFVYGVEPNEEFRNILSNTLAKEYPGQFMAVDGTAHQLNLPSNAPVDLIVSAQSLHTFRPECLPRLKFSEEQARMHWQKILPKDNKNRVAIWYYNLDPAQPSTSALHDLLSKASKVYAQSKTPFFNPPFFEPKEFQHYLEADSMHISTAIPVDTVTLSQNSLASWIKSYSFGPKESDPEFESVRNGVKQWFQDYAGDKRSIQLNYKGYIVQGPLRPTRFLPAFEKTTANINSPLSTIGVQHSKKDGKNIWQLEPAKPRPVWSSVLRRSGSCPNFFKGNKLLSDTEEICAKECRI